MHSTIRMHQALRILMVDDMPSKARVMKLFLEHYGHEVCTVDGGAAALQHLTQRKFDVVITAFWMPEMNGGQLVVRIRQLMPNQPIIMCTTAEPDYAVLEKPSGHVNALLLEPFSLKELREAIEDVSDGWDSDDKSLRPLQIKPPRA